ncbi:MAG: segregation and condensation protein B [Candidatus Kapaibacterium sp.]|nr:MAG: segregation and condensation protein B [Candidatus Kapabacteria bacterium]
MNLPFDVPFVEFSRQRQCRIVEAVIFASDQVVTAEQLYAALGRGSQPEHFAALLADRIAEINRELEATDRPYRIVPIAGGWQFATLPEYGAVVATFLQRREQRRLSRAALEVLAIVAYKQPVTKSEIDAVRGVNSSEALATLLERGLIAIAGRGSGLGKPLLYATTEDFLRTFGLRSLEDLPKPREIDDLFRRRAEEFASEMEDLPAGGSRRLLELLEQLVARAPEKSQSSSEGENAASG